MMPFRRMLMRAAVQIASDPRVRAKAAELVQNQVKPRAQAAWRQARPGIDAAKSRLRAAGADLKDAARTANPRRDPAAFAAELKRRFRGREGRK